MSAYRSRASMGSVITRTEVTRAHATKVTPVKIAKANIFLANRVRVKMVVFVARGTSTLTPAIVQKVGCKVFLYFVSPIFTYQFWCEKLNKKKSVI